MSRIKRILDVLLFLFSISEQPNREISNICDLREVTRYSHVFAMWIPSSDRSQIEIN